MSAMVPPVVVDVRVRKEDARGFRIWVPFVLLWPLMFIVLGLALLVTVFVDLALRAAGSGYHHYTSLLVGTIRLLPETRGTRAHIVNETSLVDIEIY
jgi:hypothetical protein